MQSTAIIENQLANQTAANVQDKVTQSAMSAFQSGNAIAAAALGLGAAALAGGIYASHAYNEHKKAKTIRTIKAIEALRLRRLKVQTPFSPGVDIPIYKIFEFDPKNPDIAKSAELNDDEIESMIHSRAPIDTALSRYSDKITSAMQQLYAFYKVRLDRFNYFTRGEKSDSTSAVLIYLIRMLHDHGKKFTGYARSIAILTGIEGFINEFSLMHSEGSERRARLQPVCNKLTDAIYELKKHSKKLSLDELIGEAWPECEEITRNLMTDFTKLITPTKYWSFIDRWWEPLLLSDGVIKPEFSSGSWGTHRRAIFLLSSPFSENLKKLAANFYKAKANNDIGLEIKDKSIVSLLESEDFSIEEREQITQVLTEECHNFLTLVGRKAHEYSANAKLHPIKDNAEVEQRAEILHLFSELLNEMISCIRLFFRLSKYSKDMGELFIANPRNGEFIFDILVALGRKIAGNILELESKFSDIEYLHKNAPLDPVQKDLINDIRTNLNVASEQVAHSIERIVTHRDAKNYELIKEQIHLDEHALLTIAHKIAIAHGIEHGHDVISPIPVAGGVNLPNFPTNEIDPDADEVTTLKLLDIKFNHIKQKVSTFAAEEMPNYFDHIIMALTRLRTKVVTLQSEHGENSQIKADKIKLILRTTLNQLVALCDKTPQIRAESRDSVFRNILEQIQPANTAFADTHSTWYGRLFNFETKTRAELENVSQTLAGALSKH